MKTVWIILGIITPILLATYWGRRNAVWGGFTIGIIVGLVMMLFFGYDWYIVGKAIISGTIVGFVAELLGKVSSKTRSQNTSLTQ